MNIKVKLALLLVMPFFALQAEVTLPRAISSNMVLQRDMPLTIWGWATKGEKITIQFNGQEVHTIAGKKGDWEVQFEPMKAGGPYEMIIRGENTITLKDILMGDVWICSGQSNMEMPMISNWATVKNAAEEVEKADYPQIRLLNVKNSIDFYPQKDIAGGSWQFCTPENIADFSATGYFFGRKLYQELGVPIGLISTNWGGTIIQAWTSWDVMKDQPQYKGMKASDFEKQKKKRDAEYQAYLDELDKEIGMEEQWYLPETNINSWTKVQMPQSFEESGLQDVDGIVWYRYDFNLDHLPEGKQASLNLGAIDDKDKTYLNGTLVGQTAGWNTPRNYELNPGILKKGKNTLVVRVLDERHGGGFSADEIELIIGNIHKSLKGEWRYKTTITTEEFAVMETGPNAFPSQLYNAMIHPFINMKIKGAIWYQGESNAFEAYKYREMFPSMIRDWRTKWGYDFPFIWAQLANYMDPADANVGSAWAELREAQHMTLDVPATGEAVLIDIGDADDIHPHNKQDAGLRLALSALNVAYGEELVFSGPVFKGMTVTNDKVYLEFNHKGSGLKVLDKYGYVKGFTIAGADQKFVWAKGEIEDGKVVVYSDEVKKPVAVRYAWANNPDDANLYNEEGLPATPFRTDKWKGVTMGKTK